MGWGGKGYKRDGEEGYLEEGWGEGVPMPYMAKDGHVLSRSSPSRGW